MAFVSVVPTAGWKLTLVVPESVVLAPLDGLKRQAILLTAAGLLLMLALVSFLGERIVRPAIRLERAAARLASNT